ncbi:hypothetical protein B2M20_04980 [Nitrobacter vulgaris]|uniref:Uncharacterized protein n=2 Tax=Nitrobacter vulgaris TaxID=29421 RepID=A0A1V4I0Y3_NITVU|nr:hypothetical protein B2M20_04980 [Nitrobacter vulgaris]
MQKKARTSQDHFLSPLPLARLFMMPEFYLLGILLGLGIAVGFAMTVPFRTWSDLLTLLWN